MFYISLFLENHSKFVQIFLVLLGSFTNFFYRVSPSVRCRKFLRTCNGSGLKIINCFIASLEVAWDAQKNWETLYYLILSKFSRHIRKLIIKSGKFITVFKLIYEPRSLQANQNYCFSFIVSCKQNTISKKYLSFPLYCPEEIVW